MIHVTIRTFRRADQSVDANHDLRRFQCEQCNLHTTKTAILAVIFARQMFGMNYRENKQAALISYLYLQTNVPSLE